MTNNIYDDVKLKFEKFLTLMANVLIGEKEILTIQNKLRRHFNTTVSDYLCSKEFQLSLESIEKIFHEQKKSKYYSLIASLDEQLKKHSIKSIKPTETHSPRPTTTTASVSTIEYDVSISDVQETIESLLDQCCQMFSDQPKTSMTKTRREEKIFRLEKRLARLSKIIRELEEKDMSLDEMAHCDLYEVEANLKRQACFVYEKIAKLQSQSVNTERILQKRIQLNDTESDYPLITKDLEQMINRSTDLPAFADVLNVVEQANKKYHLNLTEEIQRKFAEKSLKLIGKEFKTRRMADFQDIMLSRLPEDFNVEQNDPALENAEIEQVLIANERDAVIKTEQIFEEFSQIEPDPENEVNTETAGEESPEEQEEEEPVIIVEVQEIEQDAIDILSPLSVQPRTPIAADSDSPEVQSEISLTDRSVTILSTASLPPPPPSVQTLTPRRKPIFHDNELIYKLYKQCLTDNSSTKRSVPEDTSHCTDHVEVSTGNVQYFFLVRHGIYLSTSQKDDGLIELGRQQAHAAAETIDNLLCSLEKSSSKIVFSQLIHSGYKRAYQTGLITGHRLEQIHRLEQTFDNIYKYYQCWGEIHSIERFYERWKKIQRLFFSQTSLKHYVIFSHGNLLSSIINHLISNGKPWQFGNRAPHCSVSVLSYKSGDLLPKILFSPFEIHNQTLPKTINNLNPKKMRLKQILTHETITDNDWKFIVNTIIPERVVGVFTDQISLIPKFIPDSDVEARHILLIFKEFYSQLTIRINDHDDDDDANDSDDEEN